MAAAATWLLVRPAAAVDPAGGPPEGPGGPVTAAALDAENDLEVSGSADEHDDRRTWLSRRGPVLTSADASESSGPGTGTLLALLLVMGLGGAGAYLRLVRRGGSVLPVQNSRLQVLSSTKLGPRALAVTARAGGRVALLGVTDHNVTHLAWLDEDAALHDPPTLEGPEPGTYASLEAGDPDEDGGANVAADEETAEDDTANLPVTPGPLATARQLLNFQESLRKAVEKRTRPALARKTHGRGSARGDAHPAEPETPAMALAETTDDVVSTAPTPTERQVPSARRKRRRRKEVVRPDAASPETTLASTTALEGQVAGLGSLTPRSPSR